MKHHDEIQQAFMMTLAEQRRAGNTQKGSRHLMTMRLISRHLDIASDNMA